MASRNVQYIVASLPDNGGDYVLLSSTWVTDEPDNRGLGFAQMPTVRTDKYYEAVRDHMPCQPGDKRYHFKEWLRTAFFPMARNYEKQLANDSTFSSEGTIVMGLPVKRKIKRKVLTDMEQYGEEPKRKNSPTTVDYNLPQCGSSSIGVGSTTCCSIQRVQSPPASQYASSRPAAVKSFPPFQSPPLIHSAPIRPAAVKSFPRFQSPPFVQSAPIRPAAVKSFPRFQSPPLVQSAPILAAAVKSMSPLQSPVKNPDYIRVSLEDMQKKLAEMSGRIERMESLIAKVSEQCEDIKQSLTCVHGETKIVPASTSSWPTVPAYTMEQLIALDHRLVERSFYMGLSDQLLKIQGANLRALVRNILSRIISPSIREEIHCTGKSRPFAFNNSRIQGLLLDQVSQRREFASVQSNQVCNEARIWLKLRRQQKKPKTPEVVLLSLGSEEDKTDEGDFQER